MTNPGHLDEPQSAPRAVRIGRRVGVIVFWLLATYVVGGAALSIIPSLYGTGAPPTRAPRAEACAREAAELERALAETEARCVRVEAGQEP